MATIREVANLAGVSVGTVSRVINQNSAVKPGIRKRVEQVIDQLDYVPNKLGISLRQSKSNVILVLMNSISTSINAEVVDGISVCASKYKYCIILGNTQADIRMERRYYEMAKTRQADGVILISPVSDASVITDYSKYFPIVRCGMSPAGLKTPVVVVDDVQASYEAVRYLISLGSRKIAYLGTGDLVSDYRYDGYCKALRESGLPVEDCMMIRGDYSYTGSMEKITGFLKENPVDAMFCENDILAFNAIRAAKKSGLSVPEDISIIGFDDSPLASVFVPSLTTVRQDAYHIGFLAMEKLNEMLCSNATVSNEVTYVNHELVIRESTREKTV